MRPYTKNDYNRTRANNFEYIRSINEALRILNEGNEQDEELNELFGWGKTKVEKPEQALSLQLSNDENTDLLINWCKYYLSEANNSVDEALVKLFETSGEVLAKAPRMFVKALVVILSSPAKFASWSIKEIANLTVACIFGTIRLYNSAVEGAKEALQQLYKTIANGFNQFYAALCKNTKEFISKSEDKLKIWMAALSATMTAMANKAIGIKEAMGEFFAKILNDAKKGVEGAVMIAKTWLQSKSDAVLKWIKETAGDIRSDVVEKWNKLDKKVRNAYNDAVKALEDWIKDVKDMAKAAVAKVKEKADQAKEQGKEYVINKKDKAMVWSIQKAVKALSDNYTEEQVVALVRKCYAASEKNESIKPMFNGNYRINEQYFYDANARRRMKARHLND